VGALRLGVLARRKLSGVSVASQTAFGRSQSAQVIKSRCNIRPVSFNWKDKPSDGRKLGLIAQEVQPIVGEVVNQGTDPDKTLGIYYDELIPVVIKSIQDQQQEIDVLDTKIQDKTMADSTTIAGKIDALITQTGQMKNDLIQVHTVLDTQQAEIASVSAKLEKSLADIETLKGSVLSASTRRCLTAHFLMTHYQVSPRVALYSMLSP
jgi:Chaperone of endosialidase